MTKSSQETILKDERQVLTILEHHAKDSIDEIAKRCRFSRQKVWRIIKKLEEEKRIWGYGAITESEDHSFTLLFTRSLLPLDDSMKKELNMKKLDDFLPSGVKIENIIITHGTWDAIVSFYAPDIIMAKKVVDIMIQRTGKYFKDYLLLENLFPIRKNGFKNPHIKNFIDYI